MSFADDFAASIAAGAAVDLRPSEVSAIEDLYEGRTVTLDEAMTIRGEVLRQMLLRVGEARDDQPGRVAISGGAIVGELNLVGLNFDFALRFVATRLEGLDLTDTRLLALEFHGGSAGKINAARIDIAHDLVFSQGFSGGGLYMPSAQIGGDFNCDGATFTAGRKEASVLFDGARIGARVYMRSNKAHSFQANHGVCGRNARVAGGILCTGAQFQREVDFTRVQIQGELSFTGALVSGQLHLTGARISSDLTLLRTTLTGSKLSLARARIEGSLTWKPREVATNGSKLCVDLAQAKVGFLNDNLNWDRTQLRMDGFSFAGAVVPSNDRRWKKKRKDWLARSAKGNWSRWSAYPYDQLRAALKGSGHETAARAIAIERERKRLRYGGLNARDRLWSGFFWLVLGSGYAPGRFFLASALLIAGFGLGFAELSACDPSPGITECGDFETPEADAPDFRPWLFSLDAFLPLDLNQANAWSPAHETDFKFLVGEMVLGWLFTGLLVGAVTGVLRRD